MNKENSVATKPKFNKFQEAVFPIHVFELKKFLPMSLLMFCMLFVYTTVRTIKDTLIISKATGGGAECISFLKLWGVPISAILFMLVFNHLCNRFDSKKIFYIIVIFFLSVYALFGFVVYPYAENLHMSEATIISLQQSVPALKWLWPVIGNWTYSLFYIMADLWIYVVFQSLFWQFANQITKINEAKRFYGLFGLIGNLAPTLSGLVLILFLNLSSGFINNNTDSFSTTLKVQIIEVIVVGTILLLIYTWMHKHVLTDPKLYSPVKGPVSSKKKVKMGLIKSLKFVTTSPYLLMIVVLVIGYGTSINLMEAIWKSQLKIQYPDPNDYSKMTAIFFAITGICTTVVTLLGNSFLRKCKWKTAALITPIVFLIFGSLLITFTVYGNHVGMEKNILGISVLTLSVFIGMFQLAISKGFKYSLFDSTKNMAYIPLDPEFKVRGQAAVESVGGSFGKAGGALIQQVLFAIFGTGASITGLAGIIGPIVIVVIFAWIAAACGLSKKFEALVASKGDQEDEVLEQTKEEVTSTK